MNYLIRDLIRKIDYSIRDVEYSTKILAIIVLPPFIIFTIIFFKYSNQELFRNLMPTIILFQLIVILNHYYNQKLKRLNIFTKNIYKTYESTLNSIIENKIEFKKNKIENENLFRIYYNNKNKIENDLIYLENNNSIIENKISLSSNIKKIIEEIISIKNKKYFILDKFNNIEKFELNIFIKNLVELDNKEIQLQNDLNKINNNEIQYQNNLIENNNENNSNFYYLLQFLNIENTKLQKENLLTSLNTRELKINELKNLLLTNNELNITDKEKIENEINNDKILKKELLSVLDEKNQFLYKNQNLKEIDLNETITKTKDEIQLYIEKIKQNYSNIIEDINKYNNSKKYLLFEIEELRTKIEFIDNKIFLLKRVLEEETYNVFFLENLKNLKNIKSIYIISIGFLFLFIRFNIQDLLDINFENNIFIFKIINDTLLLLSLQIFFWVLGFKSYFIGNKFE